MSHTCNVDVTVPPRSMQMIEGKLDGEILHSGPCRVSRGEGSELVGICCGRVFDAVREGNRILLHVTNTTNSPCQVNAGTRFGQFSTNIEEPVVISELSKYPSSSTKVDKADRARQGHKLARARANESHLPDGEKRHLYKTIQRNGDVFPSMTRQA